MRALGIWCLLLLLLVSCRVLDFDSRHQELTINLHWSQAYPDHDREDVEIGLLWSLSYLGAALAPELEVISWIDDSTFGLDLSKAGFGAAAEEVLEKLLLRMKGSETYQSTGSLPVGHFILLTLNSSWHYYAITGMPPTFAEFESQHNFGTAYIFKPGESGVAYGERHVFLPETSTEPVQDMAFYALEGQKGNLDSFDIQEYEAFDFMANGQPRFAVYGRDGLLKAGSDPLLTKAGKPSKCIWCHESKTLTSFRKNLRPELASFNETVSEFSDLIRQYQYDQLTAIQHDSFGHHRRAEFLYASVFESHPVYIASEYDVDPDKLSPFLNSLQSHTSPHFPEFEEFYYRSDLSPLGKSEELKLPSDMWETSEFEPNLLGDF